MSAQAHSRILQLAVQPAVHRAFQWLHLHQQQLRRWHLDLLRIPAPPFGEQPRAEWFAERFRELGLEQVHIDDAGNAVAELPGHAAGSNAHVLLISAHLDTVFPAGTNTEPVQSGPMIHAPGACDNGAGLTALLGLAAAIRHAGITPATTVVFAANVGEEGEGNLRGMRHLFGASPYATRIGACIALEGAGNSALVTRALASRRFRVTVTGPGGHSWTDAGAPNPILLLARALLAVENLQIANGSARITLNVGQIQGGTAVNSIPESVTAMLDLRSDKAAELMMAEQALRTTLSQCILQRTQVQRRNSNEQHPSLTIEVVGDRPAGALADRSYLLETIRAVDRHLNLRTDPGLGSTDANIPLSRGIPAVAIGTGGTAAGIHTVGEWYDPTGRDVALRRILLTLLDAAQVLAGLASESRF